MGRRRGNKVIGSQVNNGVLDLKKMEHIECSIEMSPEEAKVSGNMSESDGTMAAMWIKTPEHQMSNVRQGAMDILQSDILKLQNENRELKLLSASLETKLLSANNTIKGLQHMLGEQNNDIKALNAVLKTFEEVRNNLEQQRESFKERWIKSESQVSALKHQLEGHPDQALNSTTERRLVESHARCQGLEKELEQTQSQMKSLSRELNIVGIDLEARKAQEDYLALRVRNLEADVVSKATVIENLENRLAGIVKRRTMNDAMAETASCASLEEAWLFAVKSSDQAIFLEDMEFSPDQVNIFDSIESLVTNVQNLLTSAGEACDLNAPSFWDHVRNFLTMYFECDRAIIISCKGIENVDILPLQEFVGAVAEAYQRCSNPSKVVVALEGWDSPVFEAVAQNIQSQKYFRNYEVIHYEEWIL